MIRRIARIFDMQHVVRCIRSCYGRHTIFFTCMLFAGYTGLAQGDSTLCFSFGEETQGSSALNGRFQWPYEKDNLLYGLTGSYQLHPSFVSTEESFAFSAKVPEGNYLVKVVVGDRAKETNITIKAESRRLMVYDYTVKTGMIDTVVFMVNVRSAKIGESDSIQLKPREFDFLNWDEYLTLEFAGDRPCVRAIMIAKDTSVPTIFLTGNSTVVDQEKDPWASWGQIFPVFLKPEIAVANFAESGESLKSFIRAGRLKKIASLIKPGDYLFMEFGHNDQKPGVNHVEPYTSYSDHLMEFVKLARDNGATPVLVTSTNRRKFDEQGLIINTLEEYPEAMRALAEKEGILLIDLNTMSKRLYEALGPEGSKKAFVHYEADTFPWQREALADNTHFSTYGAWQLSKCVVRDIRQSGLPLQGYLKEDLETFSPDNPDPHAKWEWPVPENGSVAKPDGS